MPSEVCFGQDERHFLLSVGLSEREATSDYAAQYFPRAAAQREAGRGQDDAPVRGVEIGICHVLRNNRAGDVRHFLFELRAQILDNGSGKIGLDAAR